MKLRLLALLVVAVLSGGAALAGSADAERSFAGRLRAVPAATFGGPQCPIPGRFRASFEVAANETGLPLPLLVSVAYEESRMNPSARSHAGAVGLLQLLPSTAGDLRLDPLHPHSNVLAGARYLRQLFDRFRSTELALAAYNAGPAAVERSRGAPSAQTLEYVANVQARWRSLATCR